MRHSALILVMVATSVLRAEPIALGGLFSPPAGTVVKWSVTSSMTDGTYTGVRGDVPTEGKVSKTEERVALLTYQSPTTREVKIESGKAKQREVFFEKPVESEKPNPLLGQAISGEQKDGKWTFALKEKATPEQQAELDKLARRADAEVDLFGDAKFDVGATWELDLARFVKAVGLGELTKGKGSVKATLKEVKAANAAKTAVIGIDASVNGTVTLGKDTTQRLRLEVKGTWERHLEAHLDSQVTLEGTITQSGVNMEGPMRRPFTYKTPVKITSSREVISKK